MTKRRAIISACACAAALAAALLARCAGKHGLHIDATVDNETPGQVTPAQPNTTEQEPD